MPKARRHLVTGLTAKKKQGELGSGMCIEDFSLICFFAVDRSWFNDGDSFASVISWRCRKYALLVAWIAEISNELLSARDCLCCPCFIHAGSNKSHSLGKNAKIRFNLMSMFKILKESCLPIVNTLLGTCTNDILAAMQLKNWCFFFLPSIPWHANYDDRYLVIASNVSYAGSVPAASARTLLAWMNISILMHFRISSELEF